MTTLCPPTHRLRAGLALALACLLSVVPVAADEPVRLGLEDGKLPEVAEHVGKLVRLRVNGRRLEIARKHWNRPFEGLTDAQVVEAMVAQFMQNGMPREHAQQQAAANFNRPRVDYLFNQLQNTVKFTNVSSRASNLDRSIMFSGKGLTAMLETRGESVAMSFEEENAPGRKLELNDDGQGVFRLTLSNRAGTLLLVLVQSSNGRFSVADVRGDRAQANSAASFLDFYRSQRSFVEHDLYPLLAKLGVVVPAASDSPEVQRAVLARLRPLNDADGRRGEELLAALDSDDFQEREKAEADLNMEFDRFRPLIIAAAGDDGASPEVRTRLKRLLSRRHDAEQIEELIDALQLLGDAGYLLTLHAAASEEQRPHVFASLERLTGQTFGADLAKWKTWLDAQPARTAGDAESPQGE
ncbi:MAG TPA: hypothetical protein VGE52_20065 [Pirellulales bacterium]